MLLIGNKMRGIWIVSILLFIKLFLSLLYINYNPIDLDEPFSIFHSQNSLSGLFEIFKNENNPPLHFILLHFWQNLFGIEPFAVRTLSLLFSILTIPVLWKIGKTFFNERVSIIVILLFIFSDFHHYHGIEARTYSLFVLEFSILIYFLLKTFNSKENLSLKHFIFLGLINGLLFYTHYIFPLILLAECLLFLIFIRRFNVKQLVITALIFVLSILPWMPILLGRMRSVESKGTWLSQAQWSELYGLINKFLNDKWVLITFILVLVFLFFMRRKEITNYFSEQKKNVLVLTFLFIIPYLSAFSISKMAFAEIFYDRYLFFLTIPLFFLLALIFQKKERVYLISFSLFFVVYILRFNFVPDNNRDGDKLAEYVRNSDVSSIVIAPNYYDYTFLYHYDMDLFKDLSIRKKESSLGIFAIKEIKSLNTFKLDATVAVVDADFEFIQSKQSLKDWFLQNNYSLIDSKEFKGNYSVYLFNKKIP